MKQTLNLLILGPQGAGKGTQAALLARNLSIPTISVGAMYRDAILKQTSVGKTAKRYVEKGSLAPSWLTNKVVKERLVKKDIKKGVILDGYPRNLEQAKALKKYFPLTAVIWLDISDTESKKRLLNRQVCEGCELNYNLIYNPSKLKEACDACRGRLVRRADDTISGIQKRLKIYHQETEPLLNFYEKLKIVIRIDGEHEINFVQKQIVDKLKEFIDKKQKMAKLKRK